MKKTNKKKKIIIAGVAAAIVVLGGVVLGTRPSDSQNMTQEPETEQVTTRSLIKSIGATGKVVSIEKKEITSTLTGVKVSDVAVEVGDSVQAGDLLIAFDTEDIRENLSSAEESLSIAKQQNALSEENARRNVEDARRAESYQTEQAAINRDSAYSQYEDAQKDYDSATKKLGEMQEAEAADKKTYDNASAAKQSAENTLQQKEAEMNSKKADMDAAEKALADLKSQETESTEENTEDSNTEAIETAQQAYEAAASAYSESTKAYEQAKAALEEAKANYSSAEAAYNTRVENRKNQESTVNSMDSNVKSALRNYDSQTKTYDDTVASQASNVASAANNEKSTKLSSTTESQEKQVKQYKEQLEEGNLLAPFSGIVTAVNVEAGDTYTQGTLVTIQDTSSYLVEAQIDEYDISDIEVGQKVLIKTDATREKELEGTVKFISPTASQNTGSVGASYTVQISVDTPDERLRLDMTASLSIIIKEDENALTVPYNAVQTDVDGKTYVEVYEDGETRQVYVTVVMESNYYTEISAGDLKEGQSVIVVKTESDSSDAYELMMQGGGF